MSSSDADVGADTGADVIASLGRGHRSGVGARCPCCGERVETYIPDHLRGDGENEPGCPALTGNDDPTLPDTRDRDDQGGGGRA